MTRRAWRVGWRAGSRRGSRAGSRRAAGLLVLLATVVGLAALPAGALADHTQLSVFQDDQYLLYEPPQVVAETAVVLQSLGVQELRITVKWSDIAPDPLSRHAPHHFRASDPAAYPAVNWTRYDDVVKVAQALGMRVDFDVTAPGPLWAMRRHPPTTRAANHWYPSATDFAAFVHALGVRYSGHYHGVPAVSDWSIWNEPDQPGWLAPQTIRSHGRTIAQAPQLYRALVRGAYGALRATGHTPANGTILVGELAPEGDETTGVYTPMTPMPFLRDLYCVSDRYRPLTGAAASALACPTSASGRRAFARQNPGLFHATGFSHHPYYFFEPPNHHAADRNFVPIADIGRLETGLDRSFAAWHSHRRIPIYFTEYGYQTNPPDPYQVVTPAEQAIYLNEADYMAWANPRIRSMAQFELIDSAPDSSYKPSEFGYWDTFQTGLFFTSGAPKPAFTAYRMPLWIPHPHVRRGAGTLVWGQLRPADAGVPETAQVQWAPSAAAGFTTLAAVPVAGSDGYFTVRVTPPGTGVIRILWQIDGQSLVSRDAPVTVG